MTNISENWTKADDVVEQAIQARVTPGASYAICHHGLLRIRSFGRLSYAEDSPPVVDNTIWDLASLTKVVATTTSAMILHEEGRLDLDQPVCEVVPEFGKVGVTLRNLLLHNSGLPASLASPTSYRTREEALEAVFGQDLVYDTGTQAVYSDVGFILLGVAIEAIAGMSLDRFTSNWIWTPHGMRDTMFNPGPELHSRCAPTERGEPWRAALRSLRDIPGTEWIAGEVHDPTAMVMGGAAGHAGLFSTAPDLAAFMEALMAGQIVRPATLESFTRRASEEGSRALGWDTPSEGSSSGTRLGPRAFGHTGFTGSSIWADPDMDLFAILLTNRVHPKADREGIRELRIEFMDAIVDAVT